MLIYLGYVAIRLSRRLRLPVVTSFLLLGILAGPDGLNLVSSSVLGSLRIIEPIALGMITFAAGEQLRFAEIRSLSGRHYLAVGLETALPVVLVGTGAWLLTGRLEVALPVGAIAGTTGLATVMSTLKESGAKGSFARLLGFAIASDNFFAILAFSLLLPLVIGMETGGAIGALYAERLMGMVASVAIGFVVGFVVSRLIEHVRSSHELSMFVLAHVLLVVGITEYFGFSVLLAGLTMGATAVNLTREVRDRDRAFAAMGTLEFPVVAIFFLWAGASLHIRALASIGLLFAVYVVARAAGKLAGPLATGWTLRRQESQSRRFVGLGVSLLPQAGAAVGLGILARDTLPVSGQTILATVLAAVVVFELVGPMGVHWAVKFVGEAQDTPDGHPLTLDEAIKELQTRKARILAVIDSEANSSVLEMPRLLATRLTADLIIVPVHAAAAPISDWRLPNDSAGWEPEHALDPQEGSPASGATEMVLAPISVGERTFDRFVSVLTERSPDLLLVSPEGQGARILPAAVDISRRLGCPVLEIPVARLGGAGIADLGPRAAAAVEGLANVWRKARGRWSRPAPVSPPPTSPSGEEGGGASEEGSPQSADARPESAESREQVDEPRRQT